MSDRLTAWWDAYVDRLGFTPTIVQGAWMIKNGGGANASAGYHDRGGCLDLRVVRQPALGFECGQAWRNRQGCARPLIAPLAQQQIGGKPVAGCRWPGFA